MGHINTNGQKYEQSVCGSNDTEEAAAVEMETNYWCELQFLLYIWAEFYLLHLFEMIEAKPYPLQQHSLQYII